MIPSLGRPQLSDTLLSIQKQADQDYKTIVVYDGMHIVNSQPENEKTFFINIHKTSKGAGPVRNAAIPYIDTEWTAFVDDDDTISDSYVSDLRYYSTIFPEADLIIFRFFDKNKNLIIPSHDTNELVLGNVGISFAVKTSILCNIKFRDFYGEDYDFIQRCYEATYEIWLSRNINYFVKFKPSYNEIKMIKNKEIKLFPQKIIHVKQLENKEYIVLLPSNPGGLGNRFKCWLSCFATSIPTDISDLKDFDKIINNTVFSSNNKHKVETWRLCVPRHLVSGINDNFKKSEFSSGLSTKSTEFLHFHNKDYFIDFLYNIPNNIKDFYIKWIQNIPWTPIIREFMCSVEFRPDVLAVSVRSWNAKHEKHDQGAQMRAKNFNIKNYKELIITTMKNNPQYKYVFLSYDNIDLKSDFDDIPNQIKLIDTEIKTSIIDILKNCIILGNCGGIIFNRISTYAEIAWWLGLCRAEMYPLDDK